MRNILETPVPKVYAWSSKAQNNVVGAEYIIMEKLPGVQLSVVWADMEIEDRLTVTKAVARDTRKLGCQSHSSSSAASTTPRIWMNLPRASHIPITMMSL